MWGLTCIPPNGSVINCNPQSFGIKWDMCHQVNLLLLLKTSKNSTRNRILLRDARKIKIAHILSSRDNLQIAAPPPPFVFKTSKMSDFFSTFYSNLKKKSLIFGFMKTILI